MKKERLIRTVLCYALTVILFGMTVSGTAVGAAAARDNSRTYNGWFTTEPSADTQPETNPQETSEPVHSEENTENKETEKETTPKTEETSPKSEDTAKQNDTQKTEDTTAPKAASKTSTKKSSSAVRTEADASYTVTFNANGGTTVKSQTVKDGKSPVKPTDPTRNGFKFEGWFKDAQLTKAVDFSSDKVAGNVTVYAKWTPLAGTVIRNISFTPSESGGGSITVNPAQAVAGETVFITIVPDDGMIIKAGTLKVNGAVTDKLSFKMPDTDVTITAEFEPAPAQAENNRGLSRTVIIAVIAVILVVATLVVISFAMKEKPMNEIEADWRDHSIVLSDFKKKEADDGENSDNTQNTESESTDETE